MDANIKIATRDLIIAEQYREIVLLKQELTNIQKEKIKEMDKGAE